MVKGIRRACFASFVVAVLWAVPSPAQEVESPPRGAYWLNLGFGACTLGSGAIAASVSYQWGENVLTLRGTENLESIFEDAIWDVGLLYGRALRTEHFFLSGGAGIAAVGGTRSEGLLGPDEKIDTTFGLPLEVQAFWRPFRNVFGLGIYGYGNLNSEETFFGATLCVHLGKFR